MSMRLKPVEEQAVGLMGASSGIGRESALRFAGRGAKVVVSVRGEEGLAPGYVGGFRMPPKPEQRRVRRGRRPLPAVASGEPRLDRDFERGGPYERDRRRFPGEATLGVGGEEDLRLPGRRYHRHHGRPAPGRERPRVDPGTARGDGFAHGFSPPPAHPPAARGPRHRAGNDRELIQVRHEEMASLMACAHAKFTGEVGVCLATSGPGAIHLLNGLYDAKMDHRPVVAIVGQQALASLGGDYQQEVDLVSLFKDVANEYVHVLANPTQARHLVDRAFRIAKAERTVTCLVVPYDVQELEAVEQPPHAHGSIFSGVGYSEPRVLPFEEDLLRAAEVLNSGERVAILGGAGASGGEGR